MDHTRWEIRAKFLRNLGRTCAAEEAEAMVKRYDLRSSAGL
jgi:hypothetical protein